MRPAAVSGERGVSWWRRAVVRYCPDWLPSRRALTKRPPGICGRGRGSYSAERVPEAATAVPCGAARLSRVAALVSVARSGHHNSRSGHHNSRATVVVNGTSVLMQSTSTGWRRWRSTWCHPGVCGSAQPAFPVDGASEKPTLPPDFRIQTKTGQLRRKLAGGRVENSPGDD
jgi:hypothetical protein